jgi:hypothetical protein
VTLKSSRHFQKCDRAANLSAKHANEFPTIPDTRGRDARENLIRNNIDFILENGHLAVNRTKEATRDIMRMLLFAYDFGVDPAGKVSVCTRGAAAESTQSLTRRSEAENVTERPP